MENGNLFDKARNNWDDSEKLQSLLVDIAEEYNQVGTTYGNATAEFAKTFISEKENSFKTSVTEIEYRVKSSMGGLVESLRENLVALSFLYRAVASRADYLVHTSEKLPF
jgi:hypothetical protein